MPSYHVPLTEETGDMSTYILQSQHLSQTTPVIEGIDTLPKLLEWQACRRNKATLFSFRPHGEASLIVMSYAETYEVTTRLSNTLRRLYLHPEPRSQAVGIWFDKSIELHLAILATTVSGAAWLPFDTDAPTARVEACLKDSQASVLLCDAAHYNAAVEATKDIPGCHPVAFDELNCQSDTRDSTASKCSNPQPDDTAYIIYTSGSTGTPKGIEISHRAAVSFCFSERSILETGPDDIVWQGFSPAFDMFIEEV
jgi:non-ribosomal peptide synthetase component F